MKNYKRAQRGEFMPATAEKSLRGLSPRYLKLGRADDAWLAVFKELREELRRSSGLPRDYDPLVEIAKLGLRKDIGPALAFLCHREVAAYIHPRLNVGQGSLFGDEKAESGAVAKFLDRQ
jgi:hypothetical protein